MKFSATVLIISFWATHFEGVWAGNCRRHDGDTCAIATPVQGQVLQGKTCSPSPRVDQEDNESLPRPPIPTGRPVGPINPSSPSTNITSGDTSYRGNTTITARRQCGGNNVLFGTNTVFGTIGGNPSEPSGAKAGQVIFTAANKFAAISVDNGATFNTIDPTIYAGAANPATDSGFCCDQVVHYLPSIDRFAWLLQYGSNNASVNKLRVITFHPRDVDRNGINSWIYIDIVSTDLKLTGPLDYGDLAVGNNDLYISATNTGVGLVVVRVSIAALDVVGPLTYWHTDPALGTVAYFSHLSQNAGDTVFWAGHSMIGTTMRVYKWPDSGTTYFWSDIRINDWPSDFGNFVSPCPSDSSTNWVYGAQFHDIIGVTRRSANEVWFAWPSPNGGGFPNLHIQIAQINTLAWPSLGLIKQWQIWNPNFVFGYPALYTNTCGDVGIAVAFGGGTFNPSSAVGIADSNGVLTQTVYYPELSNVCEGRFGDYLTVRQGTGTGFAGFIFAGQRTSSGAEWHPRFLEYRRG